MASQIFSGGGERGSCLLVVCLVSLAFDLEGLLFLSSQVAKSRVKTAPIGYTACALTELHCSHWPS